MPPRVFGNLLWPAAAVSRGFEYRAYVGRMDASSCGRDREGWVAAGQACPNRPLDFVADARATALRQGSRRMSSQISVVSQATGTARVIVPPPLPLSERRASADLFDDTDEDMRRLTADITRVLTGRPDLRVVGSPSFRPTATADDIATLSNDEAVAHPFEWQAAGPMETPRQADQAAGWLSRARRERRRQRLRAAVSWCVALGIAGVIILAVAGSVRGADVMLGMLKEIGRPLGL